MDYEDEDNDGDFYDQKKRDKIIMLSLVDDDDDSAAEEEKGKLNLNEKVALLRTYMLHKQMSWLRTVMHDTFEE